MRACPGLALAGVLLAASARAETPEARAASGLRPPADAGYSHAVFADLAVGFVPVANDVPLILGVGVRVAGVHEVFGRIGYMPVGDDVGYGFGVVGYRAALRPGRVVRPILGGYFAGLPATCGHDERGRPSCTEDRLFILSATGGVRIEPAPWLGVSALLSLGIDSYPNPFGMVEIATTFALPLGE